MPHEVDTVTVQVFVVSSASCRPDTTWEAALAVLRQRLHQRFGEAVSLEQIEMFTPRSFEFPDVLDVLQRGGGMPIVRVGDRIVSQGGKLSEPQIAIAITEVLGSDGRKG